MSSEKKKVWQTVTFAADKAIWTEMFILSVAYENVQQGSDDQNEPKRKVVCHQCSTGITLIEEAAEFSP